MSLLIIALSIIVIGGLLALAVCKNSYLSTLSGAGSTVIGCIIGLIPVGQTIYYGDTTTIHLVWNIPYGSFFLKLDLFPHFFFYLFCFFPDWLRLWPGIHDGLSARRSGWGCHGFF